MSTPLTSRRRSYNMISRSDPRVQITMTGEKRRSQSGMSPSLGGESPQLPDVQNEEDARERRIKRRSRTLAQATGSPLARPGVEDSLGETAKLTNDQLATHYINCIKLSTENKITAKNAFNLHLIDHMNEMLKQRCEGTLNFQMAGGTIFASAKIYASRVDAVHSEAYKVLSSLGRGAVDDEDKKASDDEGGAAPDEGRDVGRKKKKRSKILESNPTSLRLKKVDVCWQTDPLDQYYSSKFDTSCTSGLLINNLRLCSDGITLRFDSDMESPLTHNVFGSANPSAESSEDMETEENTETQTEDNRKEMDSAFTDLISLTKSELIRTAQLCPTMHSFSWSENDDSFEWHQDRMSVGEGPSMQAVISNPPEPDDLPGFGPEDDLPDDDFPDMDETKQEPPETPGAFPVGMDAELITSFMPGEYSYFKPGAFSTWEGPNHWKMKMRPRLPGSNELAKTARNNQATKGKKRKRAFQLDYPKVQVDSKEFEKVKKSTTVTKRIQEKWLKSEDDRMLPSAGEYNVLDLAKCVLQSEVQIRPVTLIHGTKKELPAAQLDPDNLASYNYDNPNDKNNYCPNMTDDEDGPGEADDDLGSLPSDFATNCDYNGLDNIEGFPDMTLSQTQNMTQMHNYQLDVEAMLQGDHLVSHPKKVEKISIAYAKKATRIDVRRLKAAMWALLHQNDATQPLNNTLAETSTLSDTVLQNGSHSRDVSDTHSTTSSYENKTFSTMYSTLPKLVPPTMAENLSIPLAFTCLLHLANEKSLKIEAMPDMSDLSIMEPMNEI